MKPLPFLTKSGWVACIASAAALSAQASAAGPADFYKGKQMRVIISSGSGGGYDTYGRVLARHYGRHMPGQPTVVPQNMPGAGGIRATNYMYANAPKDGTAIALVHSAMTTASVLLTGKKVHFDATKITWIGNMADENALCVSWSKSPIQTTKDMLTKEFVVGGTGVGSNLEIYPRVINSILGAKIKIISGYKGGNNVALAMERGEVHGRCGWPPSSIKTSRPQWLKEGKLKLLLQTGIEKDPDLPDVPLIMDFVKNGDDRAVMELVFAARSLLRPVLAPPGIPEDRKAALRAAFMKTMGDPAYQAEARKLKLLVKPKTGEAVEALVLKLHRTPKPIVERTIKAMKK